MPEPSTLGHLTNALSHISMFIEGAKTAGIDTMQGNDETGYGSLEYALDEVSAAYDAMEAPCECWNGVLWPWGTGSNSDHDWIERCDECATYECDDDAAKALAKRLGCTLSYSPNPGLNNVHCPHIDLPRGAA